MSQNQSYFWQTTRHNVYLKRSAKYHMLMVLMVILTFSTVCPAESEPKFNDDARVVQTEEVTKMMIQADNAFNNNGNEQNVVDSPNGQKTDATSTKGTTGNVGNLGFIHAFIASISVILVSELGDKTFFIAAIMAMRHARLTVFTGAIAALGLMTVLSAVFGMAATIIPRVYTYYISTALFAIFGLKMLKEGYYMKASDAQEELEEVQSDLKKREDELKKKMHGAYDETDVKGKRKNSNSDDAADAIGSRLSSNSEMQHRQRKQLTSSTSANINIDDTDSDKEDENSSQRRAMLPVSATVSMNDFNDKPTTSKMSSFISNRSMSTETTATPVATNQNYDNKASGDASMINGDVHSSVRSLVDPGVHSTSLRYSTDLNATDNIINGSLCKSNSTGQTNGKMCNADSGANSMELKQLGNKKWRDREVSSTVVQDPESGVRKNVKRSGVYLASRIFMQAFTMTFLAEWGDRSQLTTIILSAREDVYGVIIGGVLGHSVCTGLAVIGGRMIAQKISVRTVTIVGGVVFLLFAITSLFMSPDEDA